ncbi:Transcriptional regulator, LysR family [Granulibacter bethesdensis]|uniref:Transcriptional regulator, LysR family n=1 Tax=Granulibacter bethesdensis TaxID=364410 RepID=A0AAC9P988_9PROT|nr:LysR family transcriptional regulator [Granulibacter bethesdensis]APH54799.1 Transcriptional regulator, LysR family [Granulibacter bethesdensis]APH62385.1 Transcriptional regulator, LysR family [Granulibacter bethesdensis]
MTLEQLRIFIGVAEREHVTRAAEALNITQSAASSAIAALEARYGVALFHRVGRGITLTEAGRAFLDEARLVIRQAAHAEKMLAEFTDMARGTLSIVASQTIASYWLPPRLAAFRTRYPQITLELGIDNTEGVAARILNGSADLGFIEGMVDEASLARWVMATDPMVLVSRESTGPVDTQWLRTARWIMREKGSGTRSTCDGIIHAHGIDPTSLTIAMTLPSNEAVRGAVEAGAGVAMLSRLVVERALTEGDLIELPLVLPDRSFHALRHKERYRSRAADAFTDLIRELKS